MNSKPSHTQKYAVLFLYSFYGTTLACIPMAVAQGVEKMTDSTRQTKVTLFGQPCLLRGPFEETTLQAIHEISPERISTSFSLPYNQGSQSFKNSLSKLRSAAKLPAAFDRYRDRTARRLEALAAFSEGLKNAIKQRKSAALINQIQPHITPKNLKTFVAMIRKIDDRKNEPSLLAKQLAETYSDLIEPDPEEEFHRATQKLGLKYNCAFEEHSEETESEGTEETE